MHNRKIPIYIIVQSGTREEWMNVSLSKAMVVAKSNSVENISLVVPAKRHAATTPLKHSPFENSLKKMERGEKYTSLGFIFRLESSHTIVTLPQPQVLLVISARAEHIPIYKRVSNVSSIIVMPYRETDAKQWELFKTDKS